MTNQKPTRPHGGGFLYAVKDHTDIDQAADRWEQMKREHAEWLARDTRSPWIRLACYVYLQSELPLFVRRVKRTRRVLRWIWRSRK